MRNVIWVKYYAKWAWGDSDIEYIRVNIYEDSDSELKNYFNEKSYEFNHTDHFRGFDWTILEEVPIKELKNLIETKKRSLERTKKYINELEEEYERTTKTGKYSPDNECPECHAPLLYSPGGGEHCSQCSYWFCY